MLHYTFTMYLYINTSEKLPHECKRLTFKVVFLGFFANVGVSMSSLKLRYFGSAENSYRQCETILEDLLCWDFKSQLFILQHSASHKVRRGLVITPEGRSSNNSLIAQWQPRCRHTAALHPSTLFGLHQRKTSTLTFHGSNQVDWKAQLSVKSQPPDDQENER